MTEPAPQEAPEAKPSAGGLFGPLREISPAQRRLLRFVALALLFENYDFQVINAALKQIGEDLAIPGGSLSIFTMWVRLGGVPAFFILPFIDRIGRRRLFLLSVIGLSVGTFATAFSQTALQFLVIQMFTQSAMVAATAVTVVIISEEFPAKHRGWGIGVLWAIAAMGHGLAAGLFAAIDVLPYGWRALYAFGIVPVLLLPMFRREVRETQRFAQQVSRATASGLIANLLAYFGPYKDLATRYPARALGITLIAGLANIAHAPVFIFTAYFVQTHHGWEPWQYSAMFIIAGLFGVAGNVVAGWLGDRVGRRTVAFSFVAAFPFCSWLFYAGPTWILPIAWILLVFAVFASNVTTRVLAGELFPTAYRGTASGWLVVMERAGGAVGLFLTWLMTIALVDGIELAPTAIWNTAREMLSHFVNLSGKLAFNVDALVFVAFLSLVGAFAVFLFPPTNQRELESISE